MKVTFPCPTCERPAATQIDHPQDWQCLACDHRQHLQVPEPTLPLCVVCGCPELYKKKNFPHWLGMAILIVALILSTVTYYWYAKWWTWTFLIGSALIDGGLYLLVGDVIVCYRCQAHYVGSKPNEAHKPFEITIGERFRQERLRQERTKGKP